MFHSMNRVWGLEIRLSSDFVLFIVFPIDLHQLVAYSIGRGEAMMRIGKSKHPFEDVFNFCPTPHAEGWFQRLKYPGVYFLFNGGKVVYVGTTQTLIARIKEHLLTSNIYFDAIDFIAMEDRHERIAVEEYFIDRYKPKHNKKGVNR